MRRGVAIGVAVALSTSGKSDRPEGGLGTITTTKLCRSYERSSSGAGRVREGHLERVRENVSERDRAILDDVARLRLVTGAQLERLHFAELAPTSRQVVRRRVLGRLVAWRVLATLERRIGGVRAGSNGLVYAVDTAGQRLLDSDGSGRRPRLPGVRYVRHVLDVSELYVSLAERERDGKLRLETFMAEPASWWPDGKRGVLKPDAYAVVMDDVHRDSWWIEVDRATESLPTIRRKLAAYLDFFNGGQLGPGKIMPWVLVTVLDAKRYSDVVRLIRQLPPRADGLFTVVLHNDAADLIVRRLDQA